MSHDVSPAPLLRGVVARSAHTPSSEDVVHLTEGDDVQLWFAPAVLHTNPTKLSVLVAASAGENRWTIGLDRTGRVDIRVLLADGESRRHVVDPQQVALLAWSSVRVEFVDAGLRVTGPTASVHVDIESGLTWAVAVGRDDNSALDEGFVGVLAPLRISPAAAPDTAAAIDWATPTNQFDGDLDKPRWHFLPPTGWMNEPHGILHYRGKHHIFYQRNERGPYWGDITWGHAVSDNLVDWTDLGSALVPRDVPTAPDGIWSGSAVVDESGSPVLFFTAGDNTDDPNERTVLARADDDTDADLTSWSSHPHPVTRINDARASLAAQGRKVLPAEFRDPFVWREGSRWFQLVGGGIENEGGTAFLYESAAAEGPWSFRGPLVVGDVSAFPATGVMWELPSLIALEADGRTRHVLLVTPWWPTPTVHSLDHQWYWIGEWDADRGTFIPDHLEPRDLDLGGYLTGVTPSVHPDGRVFAWSITQDLRDSELQEQSGWAGHAGAPITLVVSDDELVARPAQELEVLRVARQDIVLDARASCSVDVGPMWDAEIRATVPVGGEIRLDVRASSKKGPAVTIRVSRADARTLDITIDGPQRRGRRTGVAKVAAAEEVALRVLADHSVVEIFVDRAAMFTTRAWSEGRGEAFELSTSGSADVSSAVVHELRPAQMNSRRGISEPATAEVSSLSRRPLSTSLENSR